MQTKNDLDLELELEKNQNNFFISDSIKDIVNFGEKINLDDAQIKASFNDSYRYPVLSYVKKNKKSTVLIRVDAKCLSSVILETFGNINIYINDKLVKDFSTDNYLINYKINCLENNNYLLRLKIWSKENGIWVW